MCRSRKEDVRCRNKDSRIPSRVNGNGGATGVYQILFIFQMAQIQYNSRVPVPMGKLAVRLPDLNAEANECTEKLFTFLFRTMCLCVMMGEAHVTAQITHTDYLNH